jgi:hypothetical protein
LWVLIVALVSLCPNQLHASLVIPNGYDYFITEIGTTFAGQAFTGVPLHQFDFGGSVGVRDVGNTDTIVRRLQEASVLGPVPPSATAPPIEIEIAALQLASVHPCDFGAGERYYYLTLQSGTPSTGQTTITFDSDGGGTFDSFFDIFFDIRIDGLDGDIVYSGSHTFTAEHVPWTRLPPPGAIEIAGLNAFLNGYDRGADFWPTTPFAHQGPSGSTHVVSTAVVPEPDAIVLYGVGALGGLALAWRRRTKRSTPGAA